MALSLALGSRGRAPSLIRLGRKDTVTEALHPWVVDASGQDATRAQKILREAMVVCCTCSGAGSETLDKLRFEIVVIDEAAQSTEPSTLTPLSRGARRIILAGDHFQLPPTVLSQRFGLGVSLFERLTRVGVRLCFLEVQYRMHPAIACFPCRAFYGGRVTSDPLTFPDPISRPPLNFAWPVSSIPIALIPVNSLDTPQGTSYANPTEAAVVSQLISNFVSAGLAPGQIGVITPYSGQVSEIRRSVDRIQYREVEIQTVDGFQGREKELIVVSTVRANDHGDIGFVSDWRRLNVTLTRAKRGLVVVGHVPTLTQKSSVWKDWAEWVSGLGLVCPEPFPKPLTK
eukprot:c17919_g1_i4.p1 GENE.c17919_g1_i4~~c17919_g1_i4.p1  ORF type:complete len:343 (-),score=60.78 c17919_g1_i4:101-1129(-)